MTPKEKQRELIIEIMKADENSGIYDEPNRKKTAVDYLFEKLWEAPKDKLTWYKIVGDAKDMEKDQMHEAYKQGYFVHFPSDVDFNNYYQETYE